VLQCVAVCCAVFPTLVYTLSESTAEVPLQVLSVLQCVAVCCSVLQCVAPCCTVLHRVALCCTVFRSLIYTLSESNAEIPLQVPNKLHRVLQCVAVCCSMLQYVAESCAVCCSMLQYVAECVSMVQRVAMPIKVVPRSPGRGIPCQRHLNGCSFQNIKVYLR